MGQAFLHGNGGATQLNFKVVGGTTEPVSPTENTIWVNTDVDIPSWVFSATEPEEPVEGMVWIATGTSSDAQFNALKKNELDVYPGKVKQYISGKWERLSAYIYRGEEWVQFSKPFPAEYQQVEYLQSTGTQYLRTDFKPDTTNIYRHECKFRQITTADEAYLIAGGSTSSSGGTARYNLYINNGYSGWNIGADTDVLKKPISPGVDYEYVTTIAPTTLKLVANGTQIGPVTCTVVVPTKTVGLFGRTDSNSISNAKIAKARIYYWRIYKGDELIHEYIPCYRKADSVAGMYDTVTDKFKTNIGTGTFVVGGDV